MCHVPRTFLRRTDPCFEQLRSRDQATEDLMKIDKLIPGAVNAISNMASSPSSPGPANPRQTFLLVVAVAMVVAVAKGRAKAKAPTNGTQTGPPRPMVSLRHRPVRHHLVCWLLVPLRQAVRGMLKGSRSNVSHVTKRRKCSTSFRPAYLTLASSVRLMELHSMTTAGSSCARTGCRPIIV